jgi:hypothetical protein
VLRGGFGLFYTRFSQSLVLNADRLNGVTQQQYAVSCPSSQPPQPCSQINFFPFVPPSSDLQGGVNTKYLISPELHAPYIMQTAFSMERQVTKIANLTLTYLNARGVHQLMSLVDNAPQPDPPVYPFSGLTNPIFQYTSAGVFRQNQLIANFNVRAGAKVSLFGYYSLNYANSDPIGSTNNGSFSNNFPSDQYDVKLDYGRASFAVRDRVFFGGTIGLPYAFRLSPFMIFNSGTPYNVTVGQDLADDLQFNVRPAFTANATGSCLSPTQACHYMVPTTPYDQIPINYLTGPSNFTLNLRLSKSFGFGRDLGKNAAQSGGGAGGPRGGGAGPGSGSFGRGGPGGMFGGGPATTRRYNLTFSVNARNVTNRLNAATPVGVLSSPNFGQSIASVGGPFSTGAANRKIELQAMFNF